MLKSQFDSLLTPSLVSGVLRLGTSGGNKEGERGWGFGLHVVNVWRAKEGWPRRIKEV